MNVSLTVVNLLLRRRLDNRDLRTVATKIVKLFPTEDVHVYYTDPVRKSESGFSKGIAARGKLVYKYRNLIKKSANLKSGRRRGEQSGSQVADQEDVEAVLEATPEISADINWLKSNIAPDEEVIKRWKRTFQFRQASVQHTEAAFDKIEQIYEEWPILKDASLGRLLILSDFEMGQYTTTNDISALWQPFFEKLVSKRPRPHDDYAKMMFELLSAGAIEGGTVIQLHHFYLSCFSHIFPFI